PTVVGGVLKLLTIPLIETGRAATLKDISIWPMAMTIIGSHDACTSVSATDAWGRALIVVSSFRPRARGAGRGCRASPLRPRDEQVHPELLRQKGGHQLAFDAVPGTVQRRGERPQSPLARRHGDDSSADPALAGQSDVEEPVARRLVQAGGGHHRHRPVAEPGVPPAP